MGPPVKLVIWVAQELQEQEVPRDCQDGKVHLEEWVLKGPLAYQADQACQPQRVLEEVLDEWENQDHQDYRAWKV